MGRFFSNFQVYTPEPDSGGAEAFRARVQERLHAAGFEAAAGSAVGTRRIAIAGMRSGHWRTVLDSRTASQDPEVVDESGALFSIASGGYVVSLLSHDDDFLELKLFKEGRRLSTLNSWPGYFEGRPRAAPEGDFGAWAGALPAGQTVAGWQQAWQPLEPPGDILPLLKRVAAVLALDVERCLESPDLQSPEREATYLHLHVRRTDSAAEQRRRSSPAGLGHQNDLAKTTTLAVSGRTRIEAISHSTGAAGDGLRVVAWGKAVDSGLVAVRAASLAVGTQGPVPVLLEDTPAHGGRLLAANLPSMRLPPGFTGPAEAYEEAGHAPGAGIDLWLSSRLALVLELEALRPGQGELQLAVQLLDHPEALAHWRTQLTVGPADPAP